eukprot:TRINITY_DN66700_c0_g1_i1.p1 TRINITY_DN66700_c0_g1~~TRINITY_DN66700_c0_g1_i1.p1  ORF type:complete len:203 (-),score=47.58 TRINITY_DN66700_c0_g1_i1:261-788(-)
MLNMLIGVMCETIRLVSEAETEETLVAQACRELRTMLYQSGLDADGDEMISKVEFGSMLDVQEACLCLKHLGLDVVALVDQTDFIFKDTDRLAFDDFMELVLQLRGCNTATVKDVVDLRRTMKVETIKMQQELKKLYGLCMLNAEASATASASLGQSGPPGGGSRRMSAPQLLLT